MIRACIQAESSYFGCHLWETCLQDTMMKQTTSDNSALNWSSEYHTKSPSTWLRIILQFPTGHCRRNTRRYGIRTSWLLKSVTPNPFNGVLVEPGTLILASTAPRITVAATTAVAAGEDRERVPSHHWADDVNDALVVYTAALVSPHATGTCTPVRDLFASRRCPSSLHLSILCDGSRTVSKPVVVLDRLKSPSGMTWSQRTSDGRVGSAALSSVPSATAVSPKWSSSRRVVGLVAVCVFILMSFTDLVVHVDGFVVEPASSSVSFERRLNDSAKPSWTGQSNRQTDRQRRKLRQ